MATPLEDTAVDAPAPVLTPVNVPPICPDRLYTPEELTAYGLKRTTAYAAMDADPEKRGELPHLKSIKIGRARRIRGSAFLAFLDQLEAEG